MLLDCTTDYTRTCVFNISNCTFDNNTAKLEGGAIKYTYYPPSIDQSTVFYNNTAEYGNEVSAFATQIELLDSSSKRYLASQNLTLLRDEEIQNLGLTNAIVIRLDED